MKLLALVCRLEESPSATRHCVTGREPAEPVEAHPLDVQDVLGAVLGAALERVERVDDPLAAQLDLDALGVSSPSWTISPSAAVLADERLAVDVQVHDDLRDQVDAGRARAPAASRSCTLRGVVAGRHAARGRCGGRRAAAALEIESARTRTHA